MLYGDGLSVCVLYGNSLCVCEYVLCVCVCVCVCCTVSYVCVWGDWVLLFSSSDEVQEVLIDYWFLVSLYSL